MSSSLLAAFCVARAEGAIPSAEGAIPNAEGAIPSVEGPIQNVKGPISSAKGAVQGPRLGVTATKALGGAVVRNRIKRRFREAFRMHRSELAAQWDIVINPRRSAVDASFTEIEQALMKVIARCNVSGAAPRPANGGAAPRAANGGAAPRAAK